MALLPRYQRYDSLTPGSHVPTLTFSVPLPALVRGPAPVTAPAAFEAAGRRTVRPFRFEDPKLYAEYKYVEQLQPWADGHDAIYLVAQENYPAEFVEASYPLRVKRYEVNRDTGGAGRWDMA